jgi:hypothetical protein
MGQSFLVGMTEMRILPQVVEESGVNRERHSPGKQCRDARPPGAKLS